MVPPRSDRISRVPPYSRTPWISTRTGLSPATARLSRRFRFLPRGHWPGPRSLATTSGVSVDVLSSGYLDVSVRRVRFHTLCIQVRMTLTGRVSPFGNLRIKVCSQLPEAYRSVPRPSSPLYAKAFTKCPSLFDPMFQINLKHHFPPYTESKTLCLVSCVAAQASLRVTTKVASVTSHVFWEQSIWTKASLSPESREQRYILFSSTRRRAEQTQN